MWISGSGKIPKNKFNPSSDRAIGNKSRAHSPSSITSHSCSNSIRHCSSTGNSLIHFIPLSKIAIHAWKLINCIDRYNFQLIFSVICLFFDGCPFYIGIAVCLAMILNSIVLAAFVRCCQSRPMLVRNRARYTGLALHFACSFIIQSNMWARAM